MASGRLRPDQIGASATVSPARHSCFSGGASNMRIHLLHPWDVTVSQALQIQKRLRKCLIFEPSAKPFRTVAGADVACERSGNYAFASVAVFTLPDLKILEEAFAEARLTFPYVPGLLSFREVPPLLDAFRKLKVVPDVVLCDGQGFAHPRRMGLACHLGLALDLATVGCAKSVLVGKFRLPGPRRGARSQLRLGKEKVGIVLRTRTGVKPVFVSPGHRMDFRRAVEVVLETTRTFRLPEPIRWAHRQAGALSRRRLVKSLA